MGVSHRKLAELSSLAYQKYSFVVNDCEVLIEEINGIQIVAFRGTELNGFFSEGGWRDLARDLFAIPKKTKGLGWGHAGFVSGAMDVLNEFALDRLDINKPVICTGHSLGGAFAQVSSLFLSYVNFNVIEWVGFAAPRVFVGQRDWGEIELTNYRFGNDLIPKYLPLGFLFSHPVALTPVGSGLKKYPNLSDHAVNNYLEALV